MQMQIRAFWLVIPIFIASAYEKEESANGIIVHLYRTLGSVNMWLKNNIDFCAMRSE